MGDLNCNETAKVGVCSEVTEHAQKATTGLQARAWTGARSPQHGWADMSSLSWGSMF